MIITEDIKYIGVNDHTVDLFEGMYEVPNGMSYNSYVIMDEKIAVMDTVDKEFTGKWLERLQKVLGGREPDYLIIQHMEPDHSANIMRFCHIYSEATLVASVKAFEMMKNYFGTDFASKRIIVADGDKLSLGKHKLLFIAAPMVHWPEVIFTYDMTDKCLFSADAFGRFGALDVAQEWVAEARRYYFGIVGKYGLFVRKVLTKVAELDVQCICPLHGPALIEDVERYVELYVKWSNYEPEEEGVLIAYTSVYGNTAKAVMLLEEKLRTQGCEVTVRDLSRCDMSEAVAQAFRYSNLVLATTTYNAGIFPFMREFIHWLLERKFCNRKVGLMENGGWAVIAAKLMQEMLMKSEGITFADTTVRIVSSVKEENIEQIDKLAEEMCQNQ